jgi:CSLREA domain-containing protein
VHHKAFWKKRKSPMFESRMIDTRADMTATSETTKAHSGTAAPASAPLKSWWRALRLSAALAVLCLLAAPAWAATLTVNTLADSNDGSCTVTVCSLRDAITAANLVSGDTIDLSGLVGSITLNSALPKISANMTINGPGTTVIGTPTTYGENLLTIFGGNNYRVFNVGSATVSINGLVIANGSISSGFGGGIYNAGTLTLTNCTITGNTAPEGAGIMNNGGTLTIVDSTIAGNSASGPGGGIVENGTLNVINSTIAGNSASGSGGGIFAMINLNNPTLTLTNSTISANKSNQGGGIYLMAGTGGNSVTLTLNNSIIAGNTGGDCGTCSTSTGIIFTGNNSQIGGTSPLGPLQWNGGPTQTMMPLPASSAICAGSTTYINTTTYPNDQRGFPLPASDCPSGAVDQGAVQSNYLTVNSTADTATGTYHSCTTGGTCTLRDAMNAANTGPSSYNNFAHSGDIIFDTSTFGASPWTISLASSLPQIDFPLNIQGPGASLLAVNGNGNLVSTTTGIGPGVNNSILYFTDQSTANVSGITLTNGISDPLAMEDGGGGIFNGGALTVVNSVISNSSSASTNGSNAGGGIFNSAYMLLTGSTVSGNYAGANGGGIYNANFAGMLVTGSTISSNTLPSGGGDGGGIYNGGPLQLINSTISGNMASDGGGIYDTGENAALTVTDSTISGNTAYNDDSASFGGGGGIDVYNDGSDGNGLVTVTNSIIAGNTSNGSDDLETCTASTTNCTLPVLDGTYNLSSNPADPYSIIDTAAHTTASGAYYIALGALALDGPLATTQTMMPGPGSLAIQAGSAAEVPLSLTTDQRGFPRLTGGKVDIGAVQTNYTISFSTEPTDTLLTSTITPSPVVLVTETNTNTSATDDVNGVPVTLTLNGTAGGVTGALTWTSDTNGHATYSGLTGSTVGSYTFTVAGSAIATGTAVNSSSFDIYSAPTVTNVSPASGPAAGGTTVTITGTGFTTVNWVHFGPIVTPGFTIVSDTEITTTAPAYTGTTVDVTVNTLGGTSATSAADQFTYLVIPTVTSVSPSSGLTAGGTSVTITGTGFTGASAVKFGTSAATSFTVVSTTQITATSPAGTGTVDVTVTTPGGTSATSAADQFTYLAPTTLTATSGTPQSAVVTTTFGSPLVATVYDQYSNPLSGVSVTFTAPASGARAVFSNSTNSITAITDASGQVSETVTANAIIGGPYTVTAVSAGLTTVNFSLTNLPSTFIVNTLVDDATGTGSNCLAGSVVYCSLRDAIAEATAVSSATLTPTITFATTLCTNSSCSTNIAPSASTPGTYSVTTGGTLTISKNMNIQGPGANLLGIDGGGTVQDFNITGGTVSISGLTITNGKAGNGGGISNSGTLTISNCTVSGNLATSAGGGIINNTGAVMTVSNCTISGNHAVDGGGILNYSTLTVNNSTFTANFADHGSGIYDWAALASDATLTATNSTFASNTTQPGCPTCGTAIEMYVFDNSAIVNLANDLIPDSITTSINSFANGTVNDYGGNVYTNASLSALGYHGGPTQTMMPLPGSSAICGGTASPTGGLSVSGTDQRGNPRPTTAYGASCVDAGAVQTAYSLSFTATPSSPQQSNVGFTSAPVVQLYDLNPATGQPAPIALANAPISVKLYSGSLTGTTTQNTAANGAATFTGLTPSSPTSVTNDYLIGSAAAGTNTFSVNSSYFNLISIVLPPTTLGNAQVGVSYTAAINQATGGVGSVTYAVTSGSLPAGVSLTASTGAFTGTPTAGGSFSFGITATDSHGAQAGQSYALTVSPPTIVFAPTSATLTAGTFGTAGYSASISASGGTGPYTYSVATGSLPNGLLLNTSTGAITGTPTTASATAYTFAIKAIDSSTGTGPYNATSQTYSITINKAASAILLPVSRTPVFTQNQITFTAAVGFAGSTPTPLVSGSGGARPYSPGGLGLLAGPTGTVTFVDSTTSTTLCTSVPLGVFGATLTGASVATCSVNGPGAGLSSGTHNITASFSGDTNFLLSNTVSPLSQVIVDFTNVPTDVTVVTLPGYTTTYTFTVTPVGATAFPSAINSFTLSGLPATYNYSFSPSTLNAGWGATQVTLTINVPQTTAMRQASGGRWPSGAPFALALLLLPLARRLRRAGRRMGRMMTIVLLAAGMAAVATLSGCGTNAGYFGQRQVSYPLTVTATAGTLTHTTNITLTVE